MEASSNSLAVVMHENQSSGFLSLPQEVRWGVYAVLWDPKSYRKNGNWYKKPEIEIAGLLGTCRQIHHEVLQFRPLHLVPSPRFRTFTTRLVNDVRQGLGTSRYRSINLQFNLSANPPVFRALAKVLDVCRRDLQELHLSFMGKDGLDVRAYPHGCAYHKQEPDFRKLLPDGQRIADMVPLMQSIRNLFWLRVLVISNMNMQLFPTCFHHKTQLEYLHITADPRSAVHTYFEPRILPRVLQNHLYILPTKVLQISANSMLNACQLVIRCAHSLEHLTWTIPDALLGSNTLGTNLYSQTEGLIAHLARHAPNLRTLRICATGISGGSDPNEYGTLVHAMTVGLSTLTTLRNLEIHMQDRSTDLSRRLLNYMPTGVERFYANDKLIRLEDLYVSIREKYLWATLGSESPPTADHLRIRRPYICLADSDNSDSEREQDIASEDEHYDYRRPEDVTHWLKHCEGQLAPWDILVADSCAEQPPSMFDEPYASRKGIVGEDWRRKDYMPFNNGNLRFVSYEYRDPQLICCTEGQGETKTQLLLRLNGRLIDHYRNRHLAALPRGQPIPPLCSSDEAPPKRDYDDEEVFQSQDLEYAMMLLQLYDADNYMAQRYDAAMQELDESPYKDDEVRRTHLGVIERYFGQEEQAAQVFSQERVARPEEQEPLTYPYIVECDSDDEEDGCDWMCPEAVVPTLEELNKRDREKEAKEASN